MLRLAAHPFCSNKHTDNKKAACGLKIACWNVRTLQDNDNSLERKTATVAQHLSRYNIDISALSETRFPETGELEEAKGGYTFYWSGRKSEEELSDMYLAQIAREIELENQRASKNNEVLESPDDEITSQSF